MKKNIGFTELIIVFILIIIIVRVCTHKDITEKKAKEWFDKGEHLYRLDKCEEAIECLDKAIEISPEYADAWYFKGMCLYFSSRDDAIKCFDKAIEINPDYKEAWCYKGNLLLLNARSDTSYSDEILRYFNKAIEIDPEYVDAWLGKIETLYAMKKVEEAKECLKKLIEMYPEMKFDDRYRRWESIIGNSQ